jgi:uncharacterized MAPEG superfamily protein
LRIYNKYVLSLLLSLGISNVALAAAGQRALDVYIVLNTVVYLVISLVYVYLNPRARSLLSTIGFVLIGAFLVIAGMKAAEVLGR